MGEQRDSAIPWDSTIGMSARDVVTRKFLSLLDADDRPDPGEDPRGWLVDGVEGAVSVMQYAKVEVTEEIRRAVADPHHPLRLKIMTSGLATADWSPLKPDGPDYPFYDLAYLLTAIADELDDPGSVRRKLLDDPDSTSG